MKKESRDKAKNRMDTRGYITAGLLAPVTFIRMIRNFFVKGDARSVRIKINIVLSVIFRGSSYIISFAMVPLLLKSLGPVNYGVWLTIASVMGWIELFDMGLGDGLKNKFAEARALQQHRLVREYVSTTYIAVSAIVAVMALLFYGAGYFANWSALFNVPSIAPDVMRTTIFLVFGFVLANFIFNLVVSMLIADQKPAFARFFGVTGYALSFIMLSIMLKREGSVSLPVLGVIMVGSPALVLMAANIFFYASDYSAYRPSLRFVNLSRFKDLTKLGVRFFILNFTTLVLFMTDNLIISHIASPADVAVYGVCQKYFMVLSSVFILFIGPYWIAFTDAYTKKDMRWIERHMKRNVKIWAGFSSLNVIFLLGAGFFYSLWIKNQITIPFRLSAMMAFTVALMNWKVMYVNFLNGVGKLALQLYLGIFTMIVNIPLSIFLGKTLHMGSVGVITATALCLLLYAVLLPLQYRKIISNTAKSLWGA